MLGAVAVITTRPCLFVARVGVTARHVGLEVRVGQGSADTRALMCTDSIGRVCDSGIFTTAQMEYMRASLESCNARDVG
jgi:hypothetical protein